METTTTEAWTTVEHPVIADERVAAILSRFDGRPYHWRIALQADIPPLGQTNIFWIKEAHFRERLQAGFGASVIYVASPGTLYDWLDEHGGYQWTISHASYEH
jgi:hypothetical protein